MDDGQQSGGGGVERYFVERGRSWGLGDGWGRVVLLFESVGSSHGPVFPSKVYTVTIPLCKKKLRAKHGRRGFAQTW